MGRNPDCTMTIPGTHQDRSREARPSTQRWEIRLGLSPP